MKWIKAVEQIEQALAAEKAVSVRYHRRYNRKILYFDKVDCISTYYWHGVPEKVVNTYKDQIAEFSNIIDEVIIEERK